MKLSGLMVCRSNKSINREQKRILVICPDCWNVTLVLKRQNKVLGVKKRVQPKDTFFNFMMTNSVKD